MWSKRWLGLLPRRGDAFLREVEHELETRVARRHRMRLHDPILDVQHIVDAEPERGGDVLDAPLQTKARLYERIRVEVSLAVRGHVASAHVARIDIQRGRADADAEVALHLHRRDVTERLAVAAGFGVGAVAGIRQRVDEAAAEADQATERKRLVGGRLEAARVRVLQVLRRPVAIGDGRPRDLVAHARNKEGQFGAVAAMLDKEAAVGRPAMLGSEVRVAAGLPEAIVEGRDPECTSDAALEVQPLEHWMRLQIDAQARCQCQSGRAVRQQVPVGVQRGKELELPVAAVAGGEEAALQLAGEGALQKAFERLKRRLDAEGLFDDDRKQPLPPCVGDS